MDKNTIQLFRQMNEKMQIDENIVWDYRTIISFFSKFNKTNWNIKTIYRFFSKIKIPNDLENECWFWNASINEDEYGQFWFKGSMKRAHRLMYEFFNGDITNKLQVLHKCDNPKCVNPFDLWIGTNLQNHQDKAKKGRSAKGNQMITYKFDTQFLYNILLLIKNDEIKNKAEFELKIKNVSYQHIMSILKGKIRHDVGKSFDLKVLKEKMSKNNGLLTDKQVIEIRNRSKNGESNIDLSKQFNCNIKTIYNIKNYKTRKHV
jgi:hypothetical protein